MNNIKIKIKIGREVHNFTGKDLFIDNGTCIQCTTKNSTVGWLHISKHAVKTLDAECERVQQDHVYGDEFSVFKFTPLGSKLATHKHYLLNGLFRMREYHVAPQTPNSKSVTEKIEFWDAANLNWRLSLTTKTPDLVELTKEEKAAL